MANKNQNQALVKALLSLTAPKIDNSKMINQLRGFPQGMGSKQGVYNLPADYNVKNEIKDAALFANSFAPVTGDIQSGVMAAQDFAKGDYGNAALNGLGLLPLVPSLGAVVKDVKTDVGKMIFDPRFDERVLEQDKLKNLSTVVERDVDKKLPSMSLADFEGKPFITSMSDRLAAGGLLKEINNKKLNTPIVLPGGQDYMLHNEGAWASGVKPANELLNMANMIYRETGQNPIYIPHRMAPTGGDFAHATGETMISYADTALGGDAKKALNSLIKKIVPDWVGVNNPKSLNQYQNLSATKREAIREILDKKFRNEGGLGLGEARLSVADTTQLDAPVGGIMNIGEIFANKPLSDISNNTSYPKKLEGRGIARLNENENINIYQLLEDLAKERKVIDPKNPSSDDMRALMMKPYSGRITSDMLKKLGY